MVKHRMSHSGLPKVIFITDAVRIPHSDRVIASLPPYSAVIIRDYDHPERETYARRIVQIAHRRGIRALVAGDAELARKVGADGLHMPEYQLSIGMPPRSGFSLVTAATKSQKSMIRAVDIGVDMAVCSPVFATLSHPGAKEMGVHLLSRILKCAPLPVVALGGINQTTSKKLQGLTVAATAAIDGFSKD